jgi:hypothetical protein
MRELEENTLDYKAMVEDIDELVSNDWGFDVDCLSMYPYQEIPQKMAWEMQKVLMKVYTISHCRACVACGGKYILHKPTNFSKQAVKVKAVTK